MEWHHNKNKIPTPEVKNFGGSSLILLFPIDLMRNLSKNMRRINLQITESNHKSLCQDESIWNLIKTFSMIARKKF